MTTQEQQKQASQDAQAEVSNNDAKPFSIDAQIQQEKKRYEKAHKRFTLASAETETHKFTDTRLRVTDTDENGFVTVEKVVVAECEINATGSDYEQTSSSEFGMGRETLISLCENIPQEHKHLQGMLISRLSNKLKPKNPYK